MRQQLFKIGSLFLITSLWLSCVTTAQVVESPNTPDLSFNKGWKFYKGYFPNAHQVDFDDSNWREVNTPHDWAIEGPFDHRFNARTGGLPVHGTGWYRKHFTVPAAQKGKRVAVEFDGAMHNSEVWINGKYVGNRPFGYIGFEIDLTEHIRFGEENVIAVRLTPEDLAARWYPGAGLYRNVRLKYNHPVHIITNGTYITTTEITDVSAKVNIETKIKNTLSKTVEAQLVHNILDANNSLICQTRESIQLAPQKTNTLSVAVKVENPILWNLDNPNLYEVVSTVTINGQLIDEFKSSFGIRTIKFTPNNGFLLNGKRVQMNGVCMHHDLGPLGAAVNYRATERQMQIMKSMGVNALRTSHNPPSPEMLEVCDRLGVLVQVEAFDEWKIGKVPNGYHKYFDEWHERDLRDMIIRDRNHPSVVMWSIGNEILEQGRKEGWKLAKHLNDICHDEDPTRPTTAGFNFYPAPYINKLAYQIDVVGINYWPSTYEKVKAEHPDMIIYGSETSSQTSSRGIYHLPIDPLPQKETGHVSSYDVIVGPPWAYPPDVEFDYQEKNPSSLGEFIWTGFDYLGEPTPYGGRDNSTNGYWNADWPSKSAYFAPVDLCGFPKDRYYLYQSQWTTEPMVHVLPHWNWEGKEGDTIPVFAYTNAESVELFVNGKSQGTKVKGKDLTYIITEFHEYPKGLYPSKYRLSWKVPYQKGTIKVVAKNGGKVVAEKTIRTAGKPAKIVLQPDRKTIKSDGIDLSFITVKIEDADGNPCLMADNIVNFEITGKGKLAAVGNGDQRTLDSFQAPKVKTFSGMGLLIVQAGEENGTIKVMATSEGLESSQINITTSNSIGDE